MQKLIEVAMSLGLEIDLTGCEYGLHTRTQVQVGTPRYYHFLAGLARLVSAQRIIEIGTFHGGSAKALSRGAPEASVVTVDVVRRCPGAFLKFPNITQVIGDSTQLETVGKVAGPADIVFIDSLHTYEHTRANIGLYEGKYVVLDDIRLNDGMRRLWSERCALGNAFDLSELVGRACGFGFFKREIA